MTAFGNFRAAVIEGMMLAATRESERVRERMTRVTREVSYPTARDMDRANAPRMRAVAVRALMADDRDNQPVLGDGDGADLDPAFPRRLDIE